MLKREFRYYCKDRYLKNLPREEFEKYFTKLAARHKYCAYLGKEVFHPYLDFSTDGAPDIISPWSLHPSHNLPTLMKKMHSKVPLEACSTMSALCNLIHDPERAMQALERNLIARCVRVISGEEVSCICCALAVVRVACQQPLGRQRVVSSKFLLPLLRSRMCHPHPDVRIQATLTAHAIASNWLAVQAMVENHFIETIIKSISSCDNLTPILEYLLKTLALLVESSEVARITAVAADGFDICVLLEHKGARVRQAAATVLGYLFISPVGKVATVKLRLVEKLKQSMTAENSGAKVKLVSALMFATVHTPALQEAVKPSLVDQLLTMLARYDIPRELEVDAIKVLTNMTSVGPIQDRLKKYLTAFTKLRQYNKQPNASGKPFIRRHVDTLISAALYKA